MNVSTSMTCSFLPFNILKQVSSQCAYDHDGPDYVQKPMLDLLHKHLDSKGKQAKLKSPQELQDLLDVTRQLLADLDDPSTPEAKTPEQKADKDEIREKFRIVKVQACTPPRVAGQRPSAGKETGLCFWHH